jgi:hypothetical protein
MKVYKAIASVAATMAQDGIAKARRNQAQGYSFRGIDDVYNALGKVLAANGLVVLPRVLARECIERQTAKGSPLFYVTVEVEFDFVSAEDGSKHVVKTYGEAMDSADKATNKAMSAAYKYAAMQAFCIPTEGDNDVDGHTHEVAPRPAPRINDSEAELILQSLSEAAKSGLGALQDAFKEIPNSETKAAVWAKHHAELKKAASDVSLFGGDPLATFPTLKKVTA